MDLGENRVNVVFEINEGGRTKIASVNFNGNNAYGDRRLRDLISTKSSSILSYFLRNDIYAEDRLRADEEALRRFYYNHGYADFRVISSSADLDPSTNEYVINFTVEEGERYTFGDVTIESNIEGVTAESLGGLIETSAGNVYSAKDVEDTIIALTEKVAGMGYAFAQVTPRGDRNFENRTISVVYAIDQGPRTYVERIEIRGNERTRDFVIRREFDISEGDAFNQVLVQRAKRRLEGARFLHVGRDFDGAGLAARPGHSGHRPGREIDRRVLDRRRLYDRRRDGRTVGRRRRSPNATSSVAASSSASRRAAARTRATSCCPSPSPISSGGASRPGSTSIARRAPTTTTRATLTGGTIRFGLPITQTLVDDGSPTISRRKNTNTTTIASRHGVLDPTKCDVSLAIQHGVDNSPWIKSSVSGSLIYNTIDDINNPHSGIYAQVYLEGAGLGGDATVRQGDARVAATTTRFRRNAISSAC